MGPRELEPRAHLTAQLLLELPEALGALPPPELRAPAQPSGEGMCPVQQTLKHSCLSLKTSIKKVEQNKR